MGGPACIRKDLYRVVKRVVLVLLYSQPCRREPKKKAPNIRYPWSALCAGRRRWPLRGMWAVAAGHLLFLTPRVAAYAHMSAQYKTDRRFAWSLPNHANEAGLGNGVAYAIDPGLCDRLITRFREQSQSTWAKFANLGVTFVDCPDIFDAIGRAFGTWSANHKLVGFKDVSSVCTAGGAANAKDCLIAEVTIDALDPSSAEEEGLAAYVIDGR